MLQLNENAPICYQQNYSQYQDVDSNAYVIYNAISIIALIATVLICSILFFAVGLGLLFFLTGLTEDIPRAIVKSWLPFSIGVLLTMVFIAGAYAISQNEADIDNTTATSVLIYKNQCFQNPFINMAFQDLSGGLPRSVIWDIRLIKFMLYFTGVMTLITFGAWNALRV